MKYYTNHKNTIKDLQINPGQGKGQSPLHINGFTPFIEALFFSFYFGD